MSVRRKAAQPSGFSISQARILSHTRPSFFIARSFCVFTSSLLKEQDKNPFIALNY